MGHGLIGAEPLRLWGLAQTIISSKTGRKFHRWQNFESFFAPPDSARLVPVPIWYDEMIGPWELFFELITKLNGIVMGIEKNGPPGILHHGSCLKVFIHTTADEDFGLVREKLMHKLSCVGSQL